MKSWLKQGHLKPHCHSKARSLSSDCEIVYCDKKGVKVHIVCIFSIASEYVEAFKCFDLNENGHLSTKELKYAMRMLGLNPTALEVQELVNGLDYEGKRARDVMLKEKWWKAE